MHIPRNRLLKFESLESRHLLAADLTVFDINQAPEPLVDATLVHNGKLYFLDNHPELGAELHALDLETNEISLVVDINPGAGNSMAGDLGGFVAVGDVIFFTAYDPVHGDKLRAWDTDNEELIPLDVSNTEGTLNAGHTGLFAAVGEKVYFVGYDPVNGPQMRSLDSSDYTIETIFGARSTRAEYAERDGKLYFAAVSQEFGHELCILDTQFNTYEFVDINPGTAGSNPGSNAGFAWLGDSLYFSAYQRAIGGEVARLNVETNVLTLYNIIEGSSNAGQLYPLMPVGDKLYFYSETTGGSSSQLYVLDSLTEEFGLVVLEGGLTLRAIDPAFATHDGILYIFSQSPGEQGVKLRIIDSVTGQVDTIEPEPGPSSSSLSLFATMEVVGDRLYLPTNNGLEILDTITRTITTVPTFMGTGPLMRAGNQLYITSQLEGGVAGLSRFDTVTGEVDAVLLANGTAGSRPNRFIQIGDRIYLSAVSESHGRELHVLDTTSGDVELIDIAPGIAESNPNFGVWTDTRLFFSAITQAHGYELRVLDLETHAITTFNINSGGSHSNPRLLTLLGNSLYFVAQDSASGQELRSLDLTTYQLTTYDMHPGTGGSYFSEIFVVGNKLAFSYRGTSSSSDRLAILDSESGEWELLDVYLPRLSLDRGYAAVDGKLYFVGVHAPSSSATSLYMFNSADNALVNFGSEDTELGRSPGKESGFTSIGGLLFFSAIDNNGNELRVLDTTTDTYIKVDVAPGQHSSNPGRGNGFIVTEGVVYFTATDVDSGYTMRSLDLATLELDTIEFASGGVASSPIDFKGRVLFRGSDPVHGQEWRLYDPASRSVMTFDSVPGPSSLGPGGYGEVLQFGSQILFYASDPLHGNEPRLLNLGNASLTTFDLYAGVADSDPSDSSLGELFVLAGNKLVIGAEHPTKGNELYMLTLATPTPPPLPGDYNLDNTVNVADYTLWRNTLGSVVSEYTGADGDGDGLVTVADYQVWKSHYGQTYSPPATLAAPLSPADEADPAERVASKNSAPSIPPPQLTSPARRAPWAPPPRQTFALPSRGDSSPDPALLLWAGQLPSRGSLGGPSEPFGDDRAEQKARAPSYEPLELAFSELGRDGLN